MQIGTIKEIWRYPVKSMAGQQLVDCFVGVEGIRGDRGWALRDETNKEITNGKRLPLLMRCEARYREQPAGGYIPQVEIILPDGDVIDSDQPDANERLSEFLQKPVSLWPLQPATNLEHYRRSSKAARVFGRLAKYRAFRTMLPTLSSFGTANAQLRAMFSREINEPVPDISILPPSVLEFTSPPGTYFDAFAVHFLTTASLKVMAQQEQAALWDVRRFRPNFLVETTEGVEGLVETQWGGRTLRFADVELRCEIPTARCGMTTHAQSELPKDSRILRSIVKYANQNLGSYASVLKEGHVAIGAEVHLL